MFQVPDIFLDKLKCSLCDGYLNAKPVVVTNGKQICAKCYRILPHDEKELCVREISFEAIGNCLIFPCRYHKMGCDYTFTWNAENGHESECKKRYFTFPDVVSTNKNTLDVDTSKIYDTPIPSDSKESDALLSYSAQYGKIASTSLIDAEIKTGTTNLAFKNDLNHYAHNSIKLNLQGTVQFQKKKLPELLPYQEPNNNSIKSSGMYENIYSTIPSVSSVPKKTAQCLSCNAQVEKQNKNICLFGHVSCNNCKEDMCVVCVKNLDGSSRITCKNAARGCKEILLQGDVGFHRDNCDFNEISCPVDKCDKKEVFEKLKEHLTESHPEKLMTSSEGAKTVGQKDQILVFLCYEGIFKCLYYYYGTSVEILPVYLGPCAKSSEFSFEVCVEVNKKTIKKSLECANWNNYMLASGVNFDRKDLLKVGEKRLSCVFNFRIIRAKH